ncbi:Bug family tripartite tricarboxylate transporter substrate binding protein [Roseovarius atlanticus]|uniref:Bug family tripartite tricarboxylate transporter substrate binding protein n=1 Tax=Roseovarius atlanticus TaxID=1641875 RepID=UPI001C96A66F|nr:tripartite tricarboxylate transporter substrate binding protein [Roseovarius atlanticus]MBY5990369.1 tripartite tricarboxylate transporter substrate binding protein [Roseovarius atlanticus]MBY6126915.1 tripartite tricarboxylate transporter substrate binding protein [Roseovarius atlanticus]MBY6151408.1 tripartite tricarboxylate transporter substrate binding protein [Roseovarius atlanticus]
MKLNRRTLIGAVSATAMLAFGGSAMAQDYPTKRITIIVPYSAGGATDILARQVADGLAQVLDETVTVENRPGAGATLGTTQAAKARPDGYTLFMGQVSSHGIAPAVYKNLQYDPVADFAPVKLIMSIPNVMVVNKDSPYQTAQEFLDAAKSENMTFGSSGVGSSIHLSGEMFKARTGADMTHVPFRGSGEAVPALLSGDVDVMFDNLPSAMPHIQSGALRALAVTTPERSDQLEDVPTLDELDIAELDGFAARSWFGILAPAGTDEAVVATLSEALDEVITSDSFKKFADTRGASIEGGSPEDFAKYIEGELSSWKTVVDEAGVTVE